MIPEVEDIDDSDSDTGSYTTEDNSQGPAKSDVDGGFFEEGFFENELEGLDDEDDDEDGAEDLTGDDDAPASHHDSWLTLDQQDSQHSSSPSKIRRENGLSGKQSVPDAKEESCGPPVYFSLDRDARKVPGQVCRNKDRALYYKLTVSGQYNCVRNAFRRAGFLPTSANNFNVLWGKPLKIAEYKELCEYQKVNHFPGTFLLGRKDNLARVCNKFRRVFGSDSFQYLPKTFVLPGERLELLQDYEEWKGKQKKKDDCEISYIVKPPAGCRGIGIRLISDPNTQIKERAVCVVSRYISDPFLINDTKFDLRIYVAITSFNPLRVYVHENGLARFCTVKYSRKTRKNRFRHLTNYSLNKQNPNFIKNTNASVDDEGHKWGLKAVWKWMRERQIDVAAVMRKIDDLILKTLLSIEVQINTNMQLAVPCRSNCFELFGFDVMLDSNLHPWLIEVNTALSLASDSPLDKSIKNQLVTEVLNMVCVKQYDRKKFCDKLEREKARRLQGMDKSAYSRTADENVRRRQVCAGKVSALDELTAEDATILREVEEENERRGGFRRIFPQNDEATKNWMKLFEVKRFYNVLQFEWVTRNNEFSVDDYLSRRSSASKKPANHRLASQTLVASAFPSSRKTSRRVLSRETTDASPSSGRKRMDEGYTVHTSPNSPTSPASPLFSPRNIELDGELRLMGRSTNKGLEDRGRSPGSLVKDSLEAARRSSSGAQAKGKRWNSFDIPKVVAKLSKASSAIQRLPVLQQEVQSKRWSGRGGQQREQWFKFGSPPTTSDALLQTKTLSHSAKTHLLDRRQSITAGKFHFFVHREQRRSSEVLRAVPAPRDALNLPVSNDARRGKAPLAREQGVMPHKMIPPVSSLVGEAPGTSRRLNFFPATWSRDNLSARALQAQEGKEGSSKHRPVSALAS